MEDGSEDTETKKEEKEEKVKDKKKKGKKGKTKSDSPEPVCIDDEFKDTQISQVEGGKGAGGGAGEAASDLDRGEVATPTHRWADPALEQLCIYEPLHCSAIDLAENPLDRRALVSLKRQLEIDQPNNKLLTVSCSTPGSELHITLCVTNREMSGHSTRPYGKGQTSRPGGKTERRV